MPKISRKKIKWLKSINAEKVEDCDQWFVFSAGVSYSKKYLSKIPLKKLKAIYGRQRLEYAMEQMISFANKIAKDAEIKWRIRKGRI